MITTPTHEDIGSLVPEEKSESPEFSIDKDLLKWLLTMWDKCESLNKSEHLDIKRNMVKARNYFDDRQYGTVNDQIQWVDYQKRPGEVNYTNNIYTGHILTAMMEMNRGKTEFTFSHVSPESRYGKLVAKVAEQRARTYRKRLFPALKTQQETLSLLLNGVAARYTYFAHTEKDRVPVFGEQEYSGAGTKVCSNCYAKMKGEECEKCGSDEWTEIRSEGKAKVVSGYDEMSCGESDWISVDPLGLTFYLNAGTVKETPFLIWKQVILHEVLQAQYPDIDILEGVEAIELKYQQEQLSAATSHLGNRQNNGGSEFNQGWFDLPLYKNYELKSDIKLRNGTILKAGTKLGEAFPLGLYIARNGNKILDLWSEDKNDKWTIAPYVIRPGTMIGAGTQLALSNQDIVNDLRNLEMASAMNDAFRKEFVNSQYIEPENIPNDPTERAVVTNLPEGGRIRGTVIDTLEPSGLSGEVYNLEDRIAGAVQQQLGTFSGTQVGAPDLKAVQETASGMAMWREMSVGRFSPMLAVKAECLEKEQLYQLLINDQKYLTPKQWEKIKGDYDAEAIKAFLKCDLRKELIIEVVPESYMPQSRSQLISDMMGYGRFLADSQIDPNSELGSYVAKQFNIPKNIVGFDAHYETAMGMIEAFKEVSEMIVSELGDIPSFDVEADPVAQQMAELVVMTANVPFAPMLDNLVAMEDAMKDWWAKDAGRYAPNVLKAAVNYRIMEMRAGTVQARQLDAATVIESEEPLRALQEAEMQKQAEAQAGQQEAMAQEQMAQQDMMAQDKAMEVELDQMNRQQDRDEKERDRQHQLEIELLKQQSVAEKPQKK